jgi:hypothetical protein
MAGIANLLKSVRDALYGAFSLPTADEMAVEELEEAKRELLRMQSIQDYSKRMCEYHADRIKRLGTYISKSMTETT